MISARLLFASAAIASLATACDLNPQPLPPGEQPDGSAFSAGPPGDGSGGSNTTGSGNPDGGAALDGGVYDGAFPPVAAGEGGVDGSDLDGSLDGTTDGESDAPLDAGDAAD